MIVDSLERAYIPAYMGRQIRKDRVGLGTTLESHRVRYFGLPQDRTIEVGVQVEI